MKKRLICMLLCLMTVMTVALTGCSLESGSEVTVGEETDTSVESERLPVTLTFWLPCEEGTTPEAVAAVEYALNDVLKSSFTTAVELEALPIDEYLAKVDEHLKKIEVKAEEDEAEKKRQRDIAKSLRNAGITTESTTETEAITTLVDTTKNEYGINELKYPSVGDYQMDIFLITSYDQYLSYIERDALYELDTALSSEAKVLRSYIYPTFLQAAKFNGTTYAIPNNHGIDNGKYLLINKELVDKYDYDPDTLNTIANCEEFIRDIGRYEDTSVIAPLLSWVEPAGMQYWSNDGNWSVLASLIPNNSNYDTMCQINSIFKINAYKSNFKLMKSFQEDGLIAENPDEVETFAVGVIEGDASDIKEYSEDYYTVRFESPIATQESIFAGAFAISSYTKNFKRAIELVTALNTDSTIRNILQYGVEGVNYKLNDEGMVERLNNDYMMNILYTGNTYMAYPEEDMDINQWADDKESNLMSIMSPFIFTPGLYNAENAAYYDELAKLSADLYARMQNVALEDVDTFFSDAHTEIMANEYFQQMYDTAAWQYGTGYIYNNFFQENFAEVEE